MRAYARTDVRIAYSVVTKYASAIAHQMWRSQVLPGYPHSSAGAYGHNLIYCLTINDKNISIIFINRALQVFSNSKDSSSLWTAFTIDHVIGASLSEPHTIVVHRPTDQPTDQPTDRPTDRPCPSQSHDIDTLHVHVLMLPRSCAW